jgi:O-antigen/teichoic acid export membrane protein
MIKNKISRGVLLGILSISVDGIAGLAIFPVLLYYQPKELAGLWILLTSFSALLNLAQAGLGPVITRMATEIKIDSTDSDLEKYYLNVNYCYRIVVLLVFCICALLYLFYIRDVLIKSNYLSSGIIVWGIMTLGYCLKIYAAKNINTVNGYGELGWDKLIQIIVTVFSNIAYVIGLYFGLSLIFLATIFFFFSVVYLCGSNVILRIFVKMPKILSRKKMNFSEILDIFKQSLKVLILNLVSVIVLNVDILIVERFWGLNVIPLYSALVKIVTLIIAVSLLIQQMIYPYISISWNTGVYKKARALYLKGLMISVITSIVLSTLLFLTAPFLIPIWIGYGNYLGAKVFGPLLLFGIVYTHFHSHVSPILATGEKTYITPAITNGFLSIILGLLGAKYLGINGIALGNILASLIPTIYVVISTLRFFKTHSMYGGLANGEFKR